MSNPKILVTGCMGQIGVELVPHLRTLYGVENVVASDILPSAPKEWDGPYEQLDVTKKEDYEHVILKYKITWVVHNAAILSGTGEKPGGFDIAVSVNIRGIEIALGLAKQHNLRIYTTSSIAAFGPDSEPKDFMPDLVAQRPTTIYGISKMYAEVLGSYFHQKWGVDFRCMRFPGIISWKQCPSGGTTDYSVEMFYFALQGKPYVCPLQPDTPLPMMYMSDCLKATADFLAAPSESLKQRVFNVNAFSLTPRMVEAAIKKEIPQFSCVYQPDFRQGIAESWPHLMDDHNARDQWGWNPQYTADAVFKDMFVNLRAKFQQQ
jgi:threonine 3-dehydrogenase